MLIYTFTCFLMGYLLLQILKTKTGIHKIHTYTIVSFWRLRRALLQLRNKTKTKVDESEALFLRYCWQLCPYSFKVYKSDTTKCLSLSRLWTEVIWISDKPSVCEGINTDLKLCSVISQSLEVNTFCQILLERFFFLKTFKAILSTWNP